MLIAKPLRMTRVPPSLMETCLGQQTAAQRRTRTPTSGQRGNGEERKTAPFSFPWQQKAEKGLTAFDLIAPLRQEPKSRPPDQATWLQEQ